MGNKVILSGSCTCIKPIDSFVVGFDYPLEIMRNDSTGRLKFRIIANWGEFIVAVSIFNEFFKRNG